MALGLGVVTGLFVLPAPPASLVGSAAHPPSSTASGTPTPSALTPTVTSTSSGSSSATPTGSSPSSPVTQSSSSAPPIATGPVSTQNLLAASDFTKVGVVQRLYVRDRVGDGQYSASDCAAGRTLGETLALGQLQAYFRGLMTHPDVDNSDPTTAAKADWQVAREIDGDAGSVPLAENYAKRLSLEQVPCETEPPSHWVFGPQTTIDVAPDISATWMGYYVGTQNTTGTAPVGVQPCGGFAVLQNGSHFGVLDVSACLGTDALTQVVKAAVTQL